MNKQQQMCEKISYNFVNNNKILTTTKIKIKDHLLMKEMNNKINNNTIMK